MLKSKQYNYLLISGVVTYCFALIIYGVISYVKSDLLPVSNKFENFDNILLILVSTIIIAPIIEELIFRYFFTERKLANVLFYGGIVTFIIFTENYYLLILVIINLILQFVLKNTRNVVLFLINAIIFALVHYKLSDFANLYSLIPALFQFSLGLILIWITINFGLKISMIFHALCNLLVIVPLVIVLQFPDKRQSEIINAKNTLKWEKTSVFGSSTISYTDKVVSAERVTIDQFLDLFHENKQGFEIEDSLRFYRYNFELKSINGEKIDKSEIDKILKQSKLINQE